MTWSDVPNGAVLAALLLQLDVILHVTHLHWWHLWKEQSVDLGVTKLNMIPSPGN